VILEKNKAVCPFCISREATKKAGCRKTTGQAVRWSGGKILVDVGGKGTKHPSWGAAPGQREDVLTGIVRYNKSGGLRRREEEKRGKGKEGWGVDERRRWEKRGFEVEYGGMSGSEWDR